MLLYVNLIVFFKTEVDSQSQDITSSFKYTTVSSYFTESLALTRTPTLTVVYLKLLGPSNVLTLTVRFSLEEDYEINILSVEFWINSTRGNWLKTEK